MDTTQRRVQQSGMRRRAGFTLLEVVLASALLALVGAAVSSTLLLASKATPPATGGSAASTRISDLIMQMSLELGTATLIQAHEPAYITFVTTDSNGDGIDEIIAYAFIEGFAGTPGRIARAFNNETQPVVEGVDACVFEFDTASVSVNGETVNVLRSLGLDITSTGGIRIRDSIRCASLPEVE